MAPLGGGLFATLVAVTIVAVALGVRGFLELEDGVDRDGLDALYPALQLVVLNASFESTELPWQLEVARFLAPIAGAAAVLQGILLLFRDRLDALRARVARRHVVVAGLEGRGARAVEALSRGHRVVVVDRGDDTGRIAAARDAGATVLVGDPAQQATLRAAGIERARHVVVAGSDDSTNVQVAFAACQCPRRRGVLTSLVHLGDARLWPPLSARAMTMRRDGHRLEFFNAFDSAARALLERHPPFAGNGASAPHVVLVGLDGPAEMLLLHVARLWSLSPNRTDRLAVTVVGAGADARTARLRGAHPRLAQLAELTVGGADVEAPELQPGGVLYERPPSAVYVCLEPEADAAAAGIALATRLPPRAVPVVVVVPDERTGLLAALQEGPAAIGGLTTFGIADNVLRPDLLLRGTNETLARAKHEQYVRAERARGVAPEQNPSIAPWSELPESLKESNRAFADRAARTLEAIGWGLVPDPLADPASVTLTLPPDRLEARARVEHDEWCEALVRDGWRRGPVKDAERREHPLLVPWTELDEAERDKDREAVAAIPTMLAEAGFTLFRT